MTYPRFGGVSLIFFYHIRFKYIKITDTHLRNVLNTIATYDFEHIQQQITEFSTFTASNINDAEKELIETFYNKHQFEPEKLINLGILHEDLRVHPSALRAIQNMKKKTKSTENI